MLPSAVDLTYFIEVATTENLSRAAERLGISQPSLSLAIQRLEENLGVAILIRSKRGVTLTQAGKQLLSQSRHLLQQWETLKAKAVHSHDSVSGNFILGCHSSVALFSLPEVLPKLVRDYPDLELKIVHDLSRRITEGIVSMQIDMGIVVNPVHHPDLVLKKLCDDEVTLWHAGHVKASTLLKNPVVLICDPELMQSREIMRRIRRHDIKIERTIVSSSLEVIAALISTGLGVGILPRRVVGQQKHLALSRLREVPTVHDEIFFCYRVENKGLRAIQKVGDYLVNGPFG